MNPTFEHYYNHYLKLIEDSSKVKVSYGVKGKLELLQELFPCEDQHLILNELPEPLLLDKVEVHTDDQFNFLCAINFNENGKKYTMKFQYVLEDDTWSFIDLLTSFNDWSSKVSVAEDEAGMICKTFPTTHPLIHKRLRGIAANIHKYLHFEDQCFSEMHYEQEGIGHFFSFMISGDDTLYITDDTGDFHLSVPHFDSSHIQKWRVSNQSPREDSFLKFA